MLSLLAAFADFYGEQPLSIGWSSFHLAPYRPGTGRAILLQIFPSYVPIVQNLAAGAVPVHKVRHINAHYRLFLFPPDPLFSPSSGYTILLFHSRSHRDTAHSSKEFRSPSKHEPDGSCDEEPTPACPRVAPVRPPRKRLCMFGSHLWLNPFADDPRSDAAIEQLSSDLAESVWAPHLVSIGSHIMKSGSDGDANLKARKTALYSIIRHLESRRRRWLELRASK